MPPIVVPVDATTADIPREPGIYILQLKFNEGIESVRLDLGLGSFVGTKVFSSRIVSKPQSPGIPDDVLDRRLNQIHESAFGAGRWVNLSRHREQIDDSQHHNFEQGTHLQDHSQQGDDDIAEKDESDQLERTEAKLLQKRLHQLNEDATGKKRSASIRKKTRKLRTDLNKTQFKDSQARALVQEIKRQRLTVSCQFLIVDACEHGIADLSKPAQNLSSTQLADLFVCQKTRDGDHGQRLFELLNKQFLELSKSKKNAEVECNRKTFETTTLAENASIVHRFHTGFDSEWLFKYKERRSIAFNKILNKLYGFMGADAWGFAASLHANGSVVGEIYDIHSGRMEQFITDTAGALRNHKFANLSDETPVFIYPAWLGWLLGYSYRDICRALELEYLAEEDPGVCDKLDKLSLKYSDLDLNSEDNPKRSELEKEAREAVTVRLGNLREIHKRLGRRDCLCPHHISQPTHWSTEPRGISVERAPGRDLYDTEVVIHSAHEHETAQLGVLSPMGGEGLENHDPMAMVPPNATAQSPSAPLMALATAAEEQTHVPQNTGCLLPPDVATSASSSRGSEPCDPARSYANGAVQAAPDFFQELHQEPRFLAGNSPVRVAQNPFDGQSGGFLSPISDWNQQRTTDMHGDHNDTTEGRPEQNLSDALGNIEGIWLDLIDNDGNFVPR